MKGVFITGTGTGVGKTYVTGLLLGALRRGGTDAVSIKPIQTGCAPGEFAPDLEEHWRLSGWHPSDAQARSLAPFVFCDPVSPHLAAQREGRSLIVSEVADAVRALATKHAFALVEGAGGILVPLNDHETMLDLICALRLPVLVVAEAGLGTINHTLLTLQALRSTGVEIFGVLLNATAPVDAELANDNASTIARMGKVPVFGVLAFGAESMDALPGGVVAALLETC